jgi:hypothetical protein
VLKEYSDLFLNLMIEYVESQFWHLSRMAGKFCDSTRMAEKV